VAPLTQSLQIPKILVSYALIRQVMNSSYQTNPASLTFTIRPSMYRFSFLCPLPTCEVSLIFAFIQNGTGFRISLIRSWPESSDSFPPRTSLTISMHALFCS